MSDHPESTGMDTPTHAEPSRKAVITKAAIALLLLLLGKGLNVIPDNVILVLAAGVGWFIVTQEGWIRQKWLQGAGYGICGAILIMLVIVACVRGKSSGVPGSLSEPQITNPESIENKYVRVTKIDPPSPRHKYAVLVEFGVNNLPSEGMAVSMWVQTDNREQWYGEPGRTDRQAGNFILTHMDGPYSTDEFLLRLSNKDFSITPRKSYYLCLLSYEREIRGPDQILYFTVELDNRTKSAQARERIGRQYELRE